MLTLGQPVFQESITVKDVKRIAQISFMEPELFWVTDFSGHEWHLRLGEKYKLILSDRKGKTNSQITDKCPLLFDYYSVNSDQELIFITLQKDIIKLSKDLKTRTTFLKNPDWRWQPWCLYCSHFTKDVLVGMTFFDFPYNEMVKETNTGKVTRYNRSGELIQTMQYLNTGQPLFRRPCIITENNNGDIVVSELHRIVVADRGGRFRFCYKGPPLGAVLHSYGICTDALSNILVTDDRTNSVQIIDRDGTFLSFLLTPKSIGFTKPGCLRFDMKTNLLWVGFLDRNTISVYKYITGK